MQKNSHSLSTPSFFYSFFFFIISFSVNANAYRFSTTGFKAFIHACSMFLMPYVETLKEETFTSSFFSPSWLDTDVSLLFITLFLQLVRRSLPNFMETMQRDITQSMRGILIDWLVEVSVISLPEIILVMLLDVLL